MEDIARLKRYIDQLEEKIRNLTPEVEEARSHGKFRSRCLNCKLEKHRCCFLVCFGCQKHKTCQSCLMELNCAICHVRRCTLCLKWCRECKSYVCGNCFRKDACLRCLDTVYIRKLCYFALELQLGPVVLHKLAEIVEFDLFYYKCSQCNAFYFWKHPMQEHICAYRRLRITDLFPRLSD